MRATETKWTEAMAQLVAAFWDEGLSTAEIGRRMGVSKGCVIGKARRLGLTPRPSPIKPVDPNHPRAQEYARRKLARRAVVTLPPLPSLAPHKVSVADRLGTDPSKVHTDKEYRAMAPRRKRPPPEAAQAPPRPWDGPPMCQWPIGDPRDPGFRYCSGPRQPGRPYCAEHCREAYQKRVAA